MAGGGSESGAAILAAFVANIGIAIAKFVGFAITGSSAMLAEAVHSVADAGNQGLLALGGRRARRAATPLHPLGYGRARYFWSFVVAVVLFSLGGLFSLYEGWRKISDPHEVTSPIVAFVVLGAAIVFEAYALRTAMKHARPELNGRSWTQYIRTSRSPELPVLLLEDSGALLGLVFAITGIALALVTGNPIFDGLGTMAIGLLLVSIAIVLALEMKSLLIGEAAAPDDLVQIEAALTEGREVRRLIHMATQHLGPQELLIGAKVEFDAGLSVRELSAAINAAEQRVRAAVPSAKVLYIEPDVYDPARAGG